MNTQQHIAQYAAHTGSINNLHYKRIGNNVVDVFSGDGFTVPTRMRLMRGVWTYVSGPLLSAASVVQVVTALS